MIESFPLQWPEDYPRTPIKKRSPFKVGSLDTVRKGILKEIKLMGGVNPIISSNIPVRLDGQLYATMRPVDQEHGVAVYFTWQSAQRVLACDTYPKIEDNLRAIEMSIEGLRRLPRYGIADVLNRVFKGFKALPKETALPFEVTRDNYKSLIKKYHPDNPDTGDNDTFLKIQAAFNKL